MENCISLSGRQSLFLITLCYLLHRLHQQFRVHLLPYAVGFEALGIEAILAMERASVECHEGGDTLAVYRKAVAVDANEWGGLHFILI